MIVWKAYIYEQWEGEIATEFFSTEELAIAFCEQGNKDLEDDNNAYYPHEWMYTPVMVTTEDDE